jgi:hypothetical protein
MLRDFVELNEFQDDFAKLYVFERASDFVNVFFRYLTNCLTNCFENTASSLRDFADNYAKHFVTS